MDHTHSSQSLSYTQLLEAVMSLLYDFDPDGVGRSIDAPTMSTVISPLSSSARSRALLIPRKQPLRRKLVPPAEPDLIKAL